MGVGGGPISVDVPALPTAPYLPPTVGPNPVPSGGTPADAWAAALALAGNGGVPGDQAASLAGEADRRAHALDAARKFPENEAQSSQQFQQLSQMIPQMASGIAGSLTGALGGVMGPLTQLPQQAMQAAQSAIQPLMGAAKGGEAAAALTDMSAEEPGFGGAGGGDAGLGGGGGGVGAGGGTTPTGFMGPPPVPSSSPPTTPAAASMKPVAVTQTGGMTPQSGPMGMTGMPMMPGAMGAGGDGNKDKPAEKRVTVPGVPNGQPVKGRLTVPPSVPVAKSGDGKPPVVAKPNRRIVIVPADEEPKE